MKNRYDIFGPDENGDLLLGCSECNTPLVTISTVEGPDVPIGDVLREHEREFHQATPKREGEGENQ